MTDIEQEARAEAVREAARYVKRIYRPGLAHLQGVLADLAVAADRMASGLHADGRQRASRPASPATREAVARALYALEWDADLYATPRGTWVGIYERRAERLLARFAMTEKGAES